MNRAHDLKRKRVVGAGSSFSPPPACKIQSSVVAVGHFSLPAMPALPKKSIHVAHAQQSVAAAIGRVAGRHSKSTVGAAASSSAGASTRSAAGATVRRAAGHTRHAGGRHKSVDRRRRPSKDNNNNTTAEVDCKGWNVKGKARTTCRKTKR